MRPAAPTPPDRIGPANARGLFSCECGISCSAATARAQHVRKSFAAAQERESVPDESEAAALAFLFRVAPQGYGGAARVRQFLFAWHNAAELGGFDLASLWSLDEDHAGAILTVIKMIARGPTGWYPSHYGYAADITALIETFALEAPQ